MKANNLSGRFFYFNPSSSDTTDARMIPMSNLTSLHMNDAGTSATNALAVTFEDSQVGDHTFILIYVTAGEGKKAIKNIVDVINSTQQIAVLADNSIKKSIISNVDWGTTPSLAEGAVGTFALSGSLTVAGAATFNGGIQRFVSLTETVDILVANSGIPHIIGPAVNGLASDSVFSLPTASAGLYYKFTYVGGESGADTQDFTLDTGSDTNFFIGGVSQFDTNLGSFASEPDVVLSDNDSNSKITVLIPAVGTYVEVFCDGTNWFISGIIMSADNTNPTFAD